MTACLVCGEPVTPRRSGGCAKQYCSPACRYQGRLLRERKTPLPVTVTEPAQLAAPPSATVAFTPENYRQALASGFDPLEALAYETDLLLAQEDSSQGAANASVVAAETGKVPAHSKDWGRDACDVRPRGNEGVASMQGDSISREAADASPQEQFERAA